MKLTYLGTSASEGWPAFFCDCAICREAARRGGKDWRFRSCAMVDNDILLDLSPDLYAVRQRLNINLSNVRHILFTHWHADHFDAPSLHWYAPHFVREVNDREPVKVYGSRMIGEMLRDTDILWRRPFIRGWVDFVEVEPFKPVMIDENTRMTALPAYHGTTEGAHVYRIERGGKVLLYLHDTGTLDDETIAYLANNPVDLVTMDATSGPSNANPESGHMCFANDIALRDRLRQAGVIDEHTRMVCNHLCIHACRTADGKMYFHEDLQKIMAPEGFTVSYDGLSIEI